MVSLLESVFPDLGPGNYRVTSPDTRRYNCIAWAAGDAENWWWPTSQGEVIHWPTGSPREETLAAFEAAFATLGYAVCDTEQPEDGFEKVALFAYSDGRPTHAARLLDTGFWTSKLGEREDIEHRLHDLAGDVYGRVVLIMKRVRSATVADAGGS